jgi:hypothetical protein
MARYAAFDHTLASPAPVIGWYPSKYPNGPADADLLEVTEEQWDARLANPSGWAVSNGALVAYTPPPVVPTLAQEAEALVAGGLAITSAGTPVLNATYPAGPATQQKLMGVQLALLATGGFPGGASTWPMVDVAGTWHGLSTAQFTAIAAATAAFVAACDLVIDGQSTTLPSASAAIP